MADLISVLPDTEFFTEGGWFEQVVDEGCVEAVSRMLASTGFVPNHDLWARLIVKNKSLGTTESLLPSSSSLSEFISTL